MKRRVNGITKVTNTPFLNMYTFDMLYENGKHGNYYGASRAKNVDELKASKKLDRVDGVIIYAVHKAPEDDEERIVLIRQYRCPLDDYIYEFPAGLVDDGENFKQAGTRELKEETGLNLTPIDDASDMFTKPFYTTVGMTDECCGTVYGYASGVPSKDGQEESEEIEIVLANRAMVRKILKEERMAIMCAYMCMHFLNTPKGHVFDFLKAGDTDE